MTVPTLSSQADVLQQQFAKAARPEQIDRAARALAAHGFNVINA